MGQVFVRASKRAKAYTRRTKSGLVKVSERTSTNTLQTNRKVRSLDLKIYMAGKASSRAAAIRAARDRALMRRY